MHGEEAVAPRADEPRRHERIRRLLHLTARAGDSRLSGVVTDTEGKRWNYTIRYPFHSPVAENPAIIHLGPLG